MDPRAAIAALYSEGGRSMSTSKSKPFEIETHYWHMLEIDVGHGAIAKIIEQEMQGTVSSRDIIQTSGIWELESVTDYGQHSHVVFKSDEPFDVEDVVVVKRKLQLLADAYHAMVEDTAAEKS